MQKYHDEPKQYKGYLKSALIAPYGIDECASRHCAARRVNLTEPSVERLSGTGRLDARRSDMTGDGSTQDWLDGQVAIDQQT